MRISPESNFGSQYFFCSSVALRTRLRPQNMLPPSAIERSVLL